MHTQNDLSFSTVVPSSSSFSSSSTGWLLFARFSPRVRLALNFAHSLSLTHSLRGSRARLRLLLPCFLPQALFLHAKKEKTLTMAAAAVAACDIPADRNVGKGLAFTFAPRFHPEPGSISPGNAKKKKMDRPKTETKNGGSSCPTWKAFRKLL